MTVDLDRLPASRLPDDIERAAYSVLAEALARGSRTVQASLADGELTISADGANAQGHADGTLPDLIAAMGGRLRSAGTRIEAVIPCV